MATIKQTSEDILTHPYFKLALEQANQGDTSIFGRLLLEYGLHCWEKCSLTTSILYGSVHRLNHCDIRRELRDCPPPTNLDLRLPFVKPQEKKPVAVIKTITKPNKNLPNPNQLQLTFPEAVIRHLKIA